jgi:hypothetical protein
MSLDHPTRNAYLKDELRNILAALQVTSANSLSQTTDASSDAYLRGFTDALRSVSIALGLLPRAATAREGVDPRRAWSSFDAVQTEAETWQRGP